MILKIPNIYDVELENLPSITTTITAQITSAFQNLQVCMLILCVGE